ncbi:cytochrome c biogenesis CcdA family protein [Sulfuricurvum sp.]|uniref:cytochrome c biogenesis CcdA family protein n=1 Tax=Sulfuricurvum sp. TaxID=2025608 RepID=UPI00262EA38B|nr:cytochrome c biogenesis protein CcdA [Sulfuricurvum sp.]MDD2267107.1 cytochrome c biogenesis protein CcdA [Sulfuricurvum sp.]MDD2782750.1 cytochrome c biogenesis protein CcdA [Sulfuricurvum sp.]HZF70147.1 cytochrome c biogenesis protein CcdA [Sulfuricurvum sp.]
MESFLLGLLETHGALVFAGAFSVGALTSLAPCSIISVPLLVGSALGMSSHLTPRERVTFTYLFSLMFAFGVTVSFSILAYMVAKMGYFFSVAPLEAYIAGAIAAIAIGLYSLGILPEVIDKSRWMSRLITLRYAGALLIGMLFGLVSTPCASAPLVAIITVASNAPDWYAYALVLTFALGHSLLLLAAGVSVGFAQSVASSTKIALITGWITKIFSFALIGIGVYFFTLAYEQF